MFKLLKIKNFQSWKEALLEFHPNINVIVPENESSPNDIGKTALLRSLFFVLKNTPSGCKYYSDFADKKGKTESELTLDDNTKIKLEKTIRISKKGEKTLVPEESFYWLDDEKFESFGVNVPDKIKDKLNITDLNIHEQLDSPFLITDTSGNIAKVINKITKQEDVDRWISSLTTKINSANKEKSILEEDIKEIDSKLKKYAGLNKLEKCINKLNDLNIEKENNGDSISYLDNSVSSILSLNEDLNIFISEKEKIEEVLNFIDELTDDYNDLIDKIEETDSHISLIENFVDIEKEIGESTSLINKYNEQLFELELLNNELNNLLKNSESLNSKISLIENFIFNNEKTMKLKKKFFDIDKHMVTLEDFYNNRNNIIKKQELLKSFIEVNSLLSIMEKEKNSFKEDLKKLYLSYDKCPFCGNKNIDDECIENVMKEY